MSTTDIDFLLEMGFSMAIAQKALNITGNKGVEPAMEWLLAHHGTETSVTESKLESVDTEISKSGVMALSNAGTIKCDSCGKLFDSNSEVQCHASVTGHDMFSESNDKMKELTEDEKKMKLQLLEDKLRQKRKDREEKEKKEELQKEKTRIQYGKEISQARKKLEEKEMSKILEMRKREKNEDRLARQKVKAQIEADRISRRSSELNANLEKKSNDMNPVTANTATRKYNETKLQIRLTDGKVLQQSFGYKEQLSVVRLFIEINRTDGSGPFTLMTNFPKRIFTETDFDLPLELLGLVPSAVVIVQKK